MVQFFERGPTKGALQSQILGEGIGGAAGAYTGQQIKKGQLASAFENLKNAPQDYLSQLEAIGPTLMTTPGGSQLLQELAPILQKGNLTKVQMEAIDKKINGANKDIKRGQPVGTNTGEPETIDEMVRSTKQDQANAQEKGKKVPRGKEANIRNVEPRQGNEPLKPQRSAEVQIRPIMTPEETNQFAYQIMQDSMGQVPLDQAMGMAEKQNENILKHNQQIQEENKRRDQFIEQMTSGVLTRAKNSGYLNDPEDDAIVEKFAMKHSNANTPEEQWQGVKKDLENYETHKNAIARAGTLPGPFQTIGRKLMGTYRDKQSILDSIQPDLDFYRENDLIPEAREAIGSSIGAGPEDIETALFPFTKEEKNDLSKFTANKNRPFLKENMPGKKGTQFAFPGEDYNLPDNQFTQFKDNLADYLENNESANTIALRGYLNQDLKYSWQDIAKGFDQLIAEGRFKPDPIQTQQLPYIKQHPTPGLTSQLAEWWTGAK